MPSSQGTYIKHIVQSQTAYAHSSLYDAGQRRLIFLFLSSAENHTLGLCFDILAMHNAFAGRSDVWSIQFVSEDHHGRHEVEHSAGCYLQQIISYTVQGGSVPMVQILDEMDVKHSHFSISFSPSSKTYRFLTELEDASSEEGLVNMAWNSGLSRKKLASFGVYVHPQGGIGAKYDDG